MNTVTTQAGQNAMKALKELEMSRNNVSTEVGRKEATIRIRKDHELKLKTLIHVREEMWKLWEKTDCQISRDCILTGIIEADREARKIKEILK